MEKLTPQLNEVQLKQNIDALLNGGAPKEAVQSYVNNYSSDGKGGYSLKGAPSLGSQLKERGQNIADINTARNAGQSATQEALNIVAPGIAKKVEPILSTAQKVKTKLGLGITNDVAKSGQIAGVVNDTLGAALTSIPGVKNAMGFVGKEISKVVPGVLADIGVNTMEDYEKFAVENPLIAKNIEGAVNIASLLPTGKAAEVTATATKDAAGAVGKSVVNAAEQSGKVVADIVPNKKEFMSGQISKALDLTQGDLSNIKLATGNDVGDFIARNNLIGASKKDTVNAVKNFTGTQYKLVREEISKVPTVYNIKDVPKVKQSLSLLEKQVKGIPGLEDTYKKVKSLTRKSNLVLSDVQNVKELLDDQFSLFKATGDVKEGTIKKGLANVRKNIKQFIEKEVKDTTGADIGQMNNDVSTGKSIMDLAKKRSTRDFTRAKVSLSDLGAFGAGSVAGTPLFGAAALAVKRIAETPTVRLRLAKFLNTLPEVTQKTVQEELLSGKVPKIIKDSVGDYRLATKIKNSSTKTAKKAAIPKVSTKAVPKAN